MLVTPAGTSHSSAVPWKLKETTQTPAEHDVSAACAVVAPVNVNAAITAMPTPPAITRGMNDDKLLCTVALLGG